MGLSYSFRYQPTLGLLSSPWAVLYVYESPRCSYSLFLPLRSLRRRSFNRICLVLCVICSILLEVLGESPQPPTHIGTRAMTVAPPGLCGGIRRSKISGSLERATSRRVRGRGFLSASFFSRSLTLLAYVYTVYLKMSRTISKNLWTLGRAIH
jgi:hypothetical protein